MRQHTLVGADGRPYRCDEPGRWGGHRRLRIYGRLDCPSALRALTRGGYVTNRVFFPDEATAVAAGYRPCGTCCPTEYRRWKAQGRAAIQTDRSVRTTRSSRRNSESGPSPVSRVSSVDRSSIDSPSARRERMRPSDTWA